MTVLAGRWGMYQGRDWKAQWPASQPPRDSSSISYLLRPWLVTRALVGGSSSKLLPPSPAHTDSQARSHLTTALRLSYVTTFWHNINHKLQQEYEGNGVCGKGVPGEMCRATATATCGVRHHRTGRPHPTNSTYYLAC